MHSLSVRYDYRYVMPPAPPTVAPIDGAKLFELHTIVKISVALVDSTVRRKVMPIAVGVVVTEDFAREPHVVDPNASAALKVYKAKVPVDHSLVAYKTRSVHFYNEKIFSSYQPADLIKIENVFVRDEGNNTNVRRQDGWLVLFPVRYNINRVSIVLPVEISPRVELNSINIFVFRVLILEEHHKIRLLII